VGVAPHPVGMTNPVPELIYVGDTDEWTDHRGTHARRAASGQEERLASGVYVQAAPWAELNQLEQYLLRIRATAETRRTGMVLSHWSAAALHGLPILGPWPRAVHFTVGRVSGGRSRRDVVKHALEVGSEDVVDVAGLTVTSLARTVLDMAVSAGQLTATMIVDRALLVDRFARVPPLVVRDDLWGAFERRGNFRWALRAERAIGFGVTRSESPLESVSRANMRIVRCPMPELQVPFSDEDGYIGDGDFYWRGLRMVGEADGRGKYLDPDLLGDKTTAQALMEEKVREDRIRATGEGVTRWPWEVGVDPAALKIHLRRAGIPIP
jgi:hypothetical protein